jgi:hypothetical protein
MVVMGAEHDRLISENRVPPGEDPDHVLADDRPGHGLAGGGCPPADGEALEPAAGGRLEPDLGEPPGKVGGRRIGAGRSGSSPLKPCVSQELDVIEQTGRLDEALGLEPSGKNSDRAEPRESNAHR